MSHHAPSTIVIGLGNPILSDDAVGWRVVDLLRRTHDPQSSLLASVAITEACVGGLSLAELMVGYEHAIVVDAIMTGSNPPGTITRFTAGNLPGTLNTASAHDTNLATALRALRRYGAVIPADDAIEIIAVEAHDVWTFSETCTPDVEASIPAAMKVVCEALSRIR